MTHKNLIHMLDESVACFGTRVCMTFGAKKVNYQEFSQITKKLARGLQSLGVKKYDKVALWLPNCPEFVYSFFAILRFLWLVGGAARR